MSKWLNTGFEEFNPKKGVYEWVLYSKNGFRRPFTIAWCEKLQDDPQQNYILPTLTTKQDRWPNAGIVCSGIDCKCIIKKSNNQLSLFDTGGE